MDFTTKLIVFLSLFLVPFFAISQISSGGMPYSFTHNLNDETTSVIETGDLDWKAIEEEHLYDEEFNNPPKIAYLFEVDYNLENSGTWLELDNGDRLWKLKIQTHDAQAIYLHYKDFYLPHGGKMFVYSADKEEYIGGFTEYNNHKSGYFATQLIHDDAVIIEYFEPSEVIGDGSITIERIGHAYRMVYGKREHRDFGDSQSCEVNVNCSPEGDNFQDQKQGVVRTLLGNYWCSAAVVNNTDQDCSPYLLTAFHCQQGVSSGQLNQGLFYFNYYAPSCNNPSSEGSLDNTTMVGCSVVAGSNDNGGSSGSDYALYQLNNPIPQNYNTFYNGWNANSTASSSGASLHNPSGDIMKISTYTSSLQSTSWGSASGSHWRVYWSSTANGHGVTEGGSSGAPLFDSQGRVNGQLTGGSSYCSTPGLPDLYGKMSYNWASNSNGDQLKNWLDPSNSGVTTLSGMYCGATIALDAGITTVINPIGSLCENNLTPSITLKNFGSNTLSTVTINYSFDGGATNTYNWTGNLGSFSTTNIDLPSINLSNGNHTFSCSTSNPNGGSDGNLANNDAASSFSVGSGGPIITLDLTLDCYGEEISWQVIDDNNVTVYSVSSGTYLGGSSAQEMEPGGSSDQQEWCLSAGCYDFVLNDTYGDGLYGSQWTCEVDGDYTITDEAGNVLAELIAPNGDFGYEEINTFCVELGVTELENNIITVYPNPVKSVTTVTVKNNGYPYNANLIDISGKIVQQYHSITEDNFLILTNSISKGVYFVVLEINKEVLRQKILVY